MWKLCLQQKKRYAYYIRLQPLLLPECFGLASCFRRVTIEKSSYNFPQKKSPCRTFLIPILSFQRNYVIRSLDQFLMIPFNVLYGTYQLFLGDYLLGNQDIYQCLVDNDFRPQHILSKYNMFRWFPCSHMRISYRLSNTFSHI